MDVVVTAKQVLIGNKIQPATITIHNGRIVQIENVQSDSPASSSHITVSDDCILLPGLVDSHVHVK